MTFDEFFLFIWIHKMTFAHDLCDDCRSSPLEGLPIRCVTLLVAAESQVLSDSACYALQSLSVPLPLAILCLQSRLTKRTAERFLSLKKIQSLCLRKKFRVSVFEKNSESLSSKKIQSLCLRKKIQSLCLRKKFRVSVFEKNSESLSSKKIQSLCLRKKFRVSVFEKNSESLSSKKIQSLCLQKNSESLSLKKFRVSVFRKKFRVSVFRKKFRVSVFRKKFRVSVFRKKFRVSVFRVILQSLCLQSHSSEFLVTSSGLPSTPCHCLLCHFVKLALSGSKYP